MAFTIADGRLHGAEKGKPLCLLYPDSLYKNTVSLQFIARIKKLFSFFIINIIAYSKK